MALPVPARLTAREGRAFGLQVGGAFLVLAAILAWRTFTVLPTGLAGVGVLLMLAGAVVPTRLGAIYRGWMAMAAAISRVTGPIMLGAVYFVVFTPFGIVRRLFARDALARARTAPTYWAAREPGRRRSDLQRQF